MADKNQQQTTLVVTVNGEDYVLDCSEFTGRECGVLKRIGHIRGISELPEAITAGDLEVVAALAVIAAKRAGIIINPETLLDGQIGNIKIALPESEDPPTPAAETRQEKTSTCEESGILP